MILNEFSKYLQAHESEIAQNKRTITLLGDWLREILLRAPMNNVEKIIHCEIALATNILFSKISFFKENKIMPVPKT